MSMSLDKNANVGMSAIKKANVEMSIYPIGRHNISTFSMNGMTVFLFIPTEHFLQELIFIFILIFIPTEP